jgi:hypothetical protein
MTPSTAPSRPAVAGILLLAVAVVGAVLLLVLVPDGDFRPDYLLVGSIPVAIVLVGGGLLLASGLRAVSGTALSWVALGLTIAGWAMVVAALSFAVLYQVSGGPMTINPWWWWLLPVGVAFLLNGGILGIVGLFRHWRLVPSLLALILFVLASLPVLFILLSVLISSLLFAVPVGSSPDY